MLITATLASTVGHGACNATVHSGMSVGGNAYTQLKATFADCCAACVADQKCAAFVTAAHGQGDECLLKADLSGPHAKAKNDCGIVGARYTRASGTSTSRTARTSTSGFTKVGARAGYHGACQVSLGQRTQMWSITRSKAGSRRGNSSASTAPSTTRRTSWAHATTPEFCGTS